MNWKFLIHAITLWNHAMDQNFLILDTKLYSLDVQNGRYNILLHENIQENVDGQI